MSSSRFACFARALALVFAAAMTGGCASTATVAYVSNADSREISVLGLDRASGELQPLQTVAVGGSVMPLAISPDKQFLFASLRSEPFSVASFRIDRARGTLTPVATTPLPDSMANLATDRSGRFLFGASYGGHKLSVSPIGTDGSVAAASQVLPTGQNAHAAVVSADNRYLFVTNLGADQVMQLRFDAAAGTLATNAAPLPGRPKAGPRHLVFHPNGRFAYLLGELDGSVDLLGYNAASGTLTLLRSWSSLPAGFGGKPWAADLHLRPDGRFLYTSERTSSTLAMWTVDPVSGELGLIGHVPTEQQPRGFAIDPSGRWLLAAGQLSHRVSVYAIDPASGRLALQKSHPVGKNPNWIEIVDLP
jgi:6-phosphogluconolactonase